MTLDDGRQLVKEVEFPRGHAANPMTDAEVEQSSGAWSSRATARQAATRVLAACWGLDKLTSANRVKLMQ